MTPSIKLVAMPLAWDQNSPPKKLKKDLSSLGSATSTPAGTTKSPRKRMGTGACPANGVAPFAATIFHVFRGIDISRPVDGFTIERGLKVAGLVKETKKGLLREWTDESVCVPPNCDTTYCLPNDVGAISATKVNVGDVNPVTVAPVTGDEGAKLISDTLGLFIDATLRTQHRANAEKTKQQY